MQPESNDEFMTLLHLLASKPEMPNGTRIFNDVIKAMADVNAGSSSGLTPLILACRHKHIGAVELLMKSEVLKVGAVDDNGKNAMCYAVMRDVETPGSERLSCELVTLLYNANADLNDGGKTAPIVEAVKQQNGAVVCLLVEFGAQPLGLSEAIAVAPLKIIQTLTNAEANPFVKDRTGKTPMDVALNRGDHEIMDLLRDFIADLQRRHHPHLQTPLQPGYDDIGIYEVDDHFGWDLGRKSTHGHGTSFKDRGVDLGDLELSAFTRLLRFLRVHCRKINKHRYFQKGMGAMLVWALFLVDFWVLCDFSTGPFLDSLLIIIFVSFLFEFGTSVIGYWKAYTTTFYFWMDLCGMLSLILDISFIRVAMGDEDGTSSDGVVMRAARMTKLGARAGRFTKLVKFLSFLPGISYMGEGAGTAKVMTQALNRTLSWQVSCLIILVTITLPLFDVPKYPLQDYSMDSWVAFLEECAVDYPSEMEEHVASFDEFYAGKDYFPVEAMLTANNTVLNYMFSRSVPSNDGNIVTVVSKGKSISVKFDFGNEIRKECRFRIGLIFVIVIMLIASSLYMSNAVSAIALLPLEDLFGNVQSTAKKIFSSLVSVAGATGKEDAKVHEEDNDDTDDESENDAEATNETAVLEMVIKKISKVSSLLMEKDPIESWQWEEMQPTDKGWLVAYQSTTTSSLSKRMPDFVLGESDDMPQGHMEELIEGLLGDVDLNIVSIGSWDINPFDWNDKQKTTACLAFLLSHRNSANGLPQADLQKYYINYIEACAAGYGSNDNVPYHNWNHAVDTAATLYTTFKEASMETMISAPDRFALLVSALAHDIGHQGNTNPFLVATHHDFAVRYNDSAPLENMHVAKLFELSRQPQQNIFVGFKQQQYRDVRQVCVEAILHTDPQKHCSIVKEVQVAYDARTELFELAEWDFVHDEEDFPTPDVLDYYKSGEAQRLLKITLLHFADVSNPFKCWDLCEMWAGLITQEFFAQGDREKELQIPVMRLNDRDTVCPTYLQIGFIEFFVGPLAVAVSNILPPLNFCVKHLIANADSWIQEWAESDARPGPDQQAEALERLVKIACRNRVVLPADGHFTPSQLAAPLPRRSSIEHGRMSVSGRSSVGPRSSVGGGKKSSVSDKGKPRGSLSQDKSKW
jgi:hypothetical protein